MRMQNHITKNTVSIYFSIFLLLILVGCKETVESTALNRPVQEADGWPTASLSEAGLQPNRFDDLLKHIEDEDYGNLHSILLVKDGRLVFEEYFNGYERERKQDVASVTKSITSALIGIAIEQGVIESVDQSLADLLPEYADLIRSDPAKEELTLRHILTMSSGLEWDEETYPYSDRRNDANRMKYESDGVHFILRRPIVNDPGTQFQYAGANSMLLSAIIKSRTGMNADVFAANTLFRPLGIHDTRWEQYANGLTDTDGGLSMRPRDMAKIGLLFLNGGQWQGEQLIPQDWIEESTRGHIPAIANATYGYQWWRADTPVQAESVETFFASGYGGQKINVYPSLNTVIIFTNDWSDGDTNEIRNLNLATNYILPAILPFSPWMAIIWLWFILVALSLIALIWHLLRHRPKPRLDWVAWIMITAIFGPFSLLLYWIITGRMKVKGLNWPRALGASFCCTTGNAIGVILLFAYLILFRPQIDLFILVLILPFFIGWILIRAPMFAIHSATGAGVALRRTFLTELITTSFVLAGLIPVILLLQFRWFPIGNFELSSPFFWLLLTLATTAGAIIVYPFNFWMARRKFSIWPEEITASGVATAESPTAASMPSLRSSWWALLTSITILVSALGLTIANLS